MSGIATRADSQRLYVWMLEHLQTALRGAHFLIAAAVAGITFILYSGTGLEMVLLWGAFLLACQGLLGLTMLAGLPLERWIRLYGICHLLACAGWGVLPVVFFQELPHAYQTLYALVVAAAAVVSLQALSYVPRLYMAGAVLMLGPMALMLLFPVGGEQYTVSLGLGLVMTVGLILLGLRVHQQHRILRGQARELLELQQARVALREHQSRLRAERERAEQAGKWDPVTGTRTQTAFLEELAPQARQGKVTLVCVRIAGFKYVNMAFGHAVGDEVLREMAARLVRLARSPEAVCRTGGGEFLAFFSGNVPALPDRLDELCDQPCETARGPVMMSAYIGISEVPSGEGFMEGLYSAMHAAEQAKQEGDTRVRTLAPADRATQRDRSRMRFELCGALAEDEFHLVFQPQHRLGDRALAGFEALLRWDSNVFGSVSPGEFIPVAEEAGLINELGEWVLRRAVHSFQEAFGHTGHRLSLNVSLAQLETDGFVALVEEVLRESSLSPQRLTLEITESTYMARPELISERLEALRTFGVKVALDDFGTGYSSLSYLTRIPLDEVKIDRTFIMDLARDRISRTLVTSLLQICRALDIRAVIEGVEEQEQLEALAGFEDIIIQGFVFARPLRLDQAQVYARDQAVIAGDRS